MNNIILNFHFYADRGRMGNIWVKKNERDEITIGVFEFSIWRSISRR